MVLSNKTLEILRNIIIGDDTSDKRTGPQLVDFFKDLGFNDTYGKGFPSRWVYTDSKLSEINGKPEIEKCVKKAFAVADYIGRIEQLDSNIASFNQHLALDKWKVIRNNDLITFQKLDKVIVDTPKKKSISENEFLSYTFDVDIDLLGLDYGLAEIIKERLTETEKCVNNEAPLASVIMIGGILEGILFGIASSHKKQFNQAQCAPKDEKGKVKKFQCWTLNNFIDVSFEIGIIKRDIEQFCHDVRNFRNYIHPYLQMKNSFTPSENTASICFQVLKAAISQIVEYRTNEQGVTD